MTTTKTPTTPAIADGISPPPQEYPDWSDLPDPEPPEDGMLQYPTIRIIDPLIAAHFAHRPDVLVARDGFLCWDRHDRNARLAPDWIIAFGVDAAARMKDNGYLIWEAGKPPDVVIEVASPNTASRDLGIKRDMYAEIAVPEYWRLDPTGGDLYGEPLVGEYLVDGEYRRFDLYRDDAGRILSHSPAMNLDIYWDGEDFGIYDPATGQYLRGLLAERQETQRERQRRQAAERARDAAETRAIQERAARLAAEQRAAQDRVARLAAEQRADQDRVARQAAETRAALAENRAATLQSELNRIRAQRPPQ